MNRMLEGTSWRTAAVCLALFVVVLGGIAGVAARKRTAPFNEPLWYMRGCVAPTNLSTDEYRIWAIDMPVLNRWAYWTVLKSTGLDRIPPGEPPAWEVREGKLCFQGSPIEGNWFVNQGENANIEYVWRARGKYAPRRAIVAMRMANVAAFGACVVLLWLTARMILGSDLLAAAAVLPLCMLRTWALGLVFESSQGDVFLLAALALVLWLWMRFHLAGRGVSWQSALAVGAAAGFAVSSKHTGVIAFGAFATYLMLWSRGWQRLAKPALAAAAAFAVFAIVNPAVMGYPGGRPWTVLSLMMERRDFIANYNYSTYASMGWSELWRRGFAWTPLVPVLAVVVWYLRRERWVAPLATWAAFITCASAAGIIKLRDPETRYVAPIEMALYFTAAVSALWAVTRLQQAGKPAEVKEKP